ncbi:MAG: TIGR03986 family type III CRISPR-associated RAMP protein, partial [Ardenticatenaceae bacterium]
QALIELCQHPLRRFEFWNVVALARPEAPALVARGRQQRVEGFLCLNNQNIENKHDERLFFRAPSNSSGRTPLPLSDLVRERYHDLIQDYQKRHQEAIDERLVKNENPEKPVGRNPAFSRFIVNNSAAQLANGDLVYAMLDTRGRELEVKFVVPVSVPRVSYDHTIGELLEPQVKDPQSQACDEYDKLCPACRTFGWVRGSTGEQAIRIAYASRVTFRLARRVNDAGSFTNTLAILSTPKPTTTRFYLAPTNSKPSGGRSDKEVGYDAINRKLRGRKVYRHHGSQLSEKEYARREQSNQNRTVRDVQREGSVFEFEVGFENLAEVELGALLWTLEMEGWHHRLGFGKPLGFGSAQVEITKLETMEPAKRYGSFEAEGWRDALAQKDTWVQTFKDAMQARYGRPFDQLGNVADLKAL